MEKEAREGVRNVGDIMVTQQDGDSRERKTDRVGSMLKPENVGKGHRSLNTWRKVFGGVTDYTLAMSQSQSEHQFQNPYCFLSVGFECIGTPFVD